MPSGHERELAYRISQFLNMRSRYQYTRSKNTSLPHFAGLTNVSAEAGIAGNDQDPLNWGPPGPAVFQRLRRVE